MVFEHVRMVPILFVLLLRLKLVQTKASFQKLDQTQASFQKRLIAAATNVPTMKTASLNVWAEKMDR